MRYKVGQRVIIIDHHVYGMNNHGAMDRYFGRIMTITQILDEDYKMEEDGEHWYWAEHMVDHRMTAALNNNFSGGI